MEEAEKVVVIVVVVGNGRELVYNGDILCLNLLLTYLPFRPGLRNYD